MAKQYGGNHLMTNLILTCRLLKLLKMKKQRSGLKRPIQEMTPEIEAILEGDVLMEIYHDRPPYQQNDYLRWIVSAKLETTRKKRLDQMIAELKNGTLYMKMDWKSR